MTRERISFTFDPRDMLLSLQIGFSFVRAAVACAILERTSGLEPSSETTAPRYLKLVTVPNFFPFTFISLWMPFALFVISLVSLPIFKINSCSMFRLINAFIKKVFFPSYCWCQPFWIFNNVSANQSLYQEFFSLNVSLPSFWIFRIVDISSLKAMWHWKKTTNGGHQQYEGKVTLKKTFLIKAFEYSKYWASAVRRQCDIERKTFLIKALVSRNVEQVVIYVTKTVRK